MKKQPNPALSRPAYGGGYAAAIFANSGYPVTMAHCKHGGRLTPTLGVRGIFLDGTFTIQGNWRGLKVHPGARGLPPASGSVSGGLFHRGVFAVGLFCPPSRPLVRLAGSVCNGVLPAGA